MTNISHFTRIRQEFRIILPLGLGLGCTRAIQTNQYTGNEPLEWECWVRPFRVEWICVEFRHRKTLLFSNQIQAQEVSVKAWNVQRSFKHLSLPYMIYLHNVNVITLTHKPFPSCASPISLLCLLKAAFKACLFSSICIKKTTKSHQNKLRGFQYLALWFSTKRPGGLKMTSNELK